MITALANFRTLPLKDASRQLLDELGYRSDKFIAGAGSSPQDLLDLFAGDGHAFDPVKALVTEWQSADLIFQLTDEELSRESSLFTDDSVKRGLLKSYVFIAIELKGSEYARGKFSAIARQINRLFPMPVMVLFKHGERLTIAVINRRRNKLDESKDVLEKATLIRDISLAQPHRGHLDILASLALSELRHPKKLPIEDFDTLHAAWEQIFNIELLNERFYRELANWYFWALPQVEFPSDLEPDDEKRRAMGLIRLLTRLIFCWFLKEKGLIPEKLFHPVDLAKLLKGFDPESETSSVYYQAILQNLFFATLNQRMGKDSKGNPYRVFATDEGFQKNKATYDVNNLFRYEKLFAVSQEEALAHFADIPFLNGGLFECLDRTEDGTDKKLYLDGFSRRKAKRPHIPDRLFFDSGETADLSDVYGDKKRKSEKVTGLITILNRYKFTIVENTPIDQEIALDPELLGKVFENLLASYNEETKTTARKQTGSFYTPRPIVEYMVDESLKAHLTRILTEKTGIKEDDAKAGLDLLFTYTEKAHPFSDTEVATLITAIDEVKVLDPACGSGAFPMGVLHKLVYLLSKVDPENVAWERIQLAKAQEITDTEERRKKLAEIVSNFAENNDDYGRKLYLIENCLYGVDIQPIAIQITKLRFFISLVCDQQTNNDKAKNRGIRPLPNLETKFVAANSLIGLPIPEPDLFVNALIEPIEKEIEAAYHSHFAIQRRDQKLALQQKIKTLRQKLAHTLVNEVGTKQDSELLKKAQQVAAWDPFDPQASADFFDPHWMFGRSLAKGFDIVIGNPPYISVERFAGTAIQKLWQERFKTYAARGDVYCFFYERGIEMLRNDGTLIYITSNKWMRAGYGKNLRELFLRKVRINEILDFGGVLVFNSATVDTCTLRLSRSTPHLTFPSSYMRSTFTFDRPLAAFAEANASTFKLPTDGSHSWAVLSYARQSIREQVSSQGIKLGEWNIQISRGIITGLNEAFYLTAEQRDMLIGEDAASTDLIVKLIRGREIDAYKVDWENTYQLIIKFGAHMYLEERYPALYRHLCAFEPRLHARAQCQYSRSRSASTEGSFAGQHHWLELDNNPTDDYLDLFGEPKIIYPEITKWLGFYFDRENHYFPNNKAFIINSRGDSLEYLTAFFNSTLFRCSFMDEFPTQGEDRRELRKIFFDKIPVKKPTSEEVNLFERLVPLIQSAKAHGQAVAAAFLEDLIDACVMECYFREHMTERDLLFHDTVVPHLAAYDPSASEVQQREFLDRLHRTLNAPSHPVRNRLLRLTADSPDLLAIIKQEGRV
ncbi:MAG: Eco57I restriction-modification methylase domain-containing protein [Bacteroidia bacterium]|nr:Eco57I restriction-modification methylase domain-containing protein [Bacteroidia bacterium]